MLLESCLRVRGSALVIIKAKDYTGDIIEHSVCETELNIAKITRSECKKRIELTVEIPTSGSLHEKSHKGERIVLMLEVRRLVEGKALFFILCVCIC